MKFQLQTIMLIITVLLVSLIMTSCKISSGTSIKEILDNPREFSGKEIQVKGEVLDTFSLVVIKYFTLKDNTGEITVVTSKLLPKKGTTIKIKGNVEEAFSIGNQQLIVINESEK